MRPIKNTITSPTVGLRYKTIEGQRKLVENSIVQIMKIDGRNVHYKYVQGFIGRGESETDWYTRRYEAFMSCVELIG